MRSGARRAEEGDDDGGYNHLFENGMTELMLRVGNF